MVAAVVKRWVNDLTLCFRARLCAYERRRAPSPRLAASLCTFLYYGPCPLLSPLLPCHALQHHANRYQIPLHFAYFSIPLHRVEEGCRDIFFIFVKNSYSLSQSQIQTQKADSHIFRFSVTLTFPGYHHLLCPLLANINHRKKVSS